MPSFVCRKWREPATEQVVDDDRFDATTAPDWFVDTHVTPQEAGWVVFVEVRENRNGAPWVLWRSESVDNPFGPEFAFALYTAMVSEAEAEAELRERGAAIPR